MKWKIQSIATKYLPDVIIQFKMDITNGNPILENTRCIFKLENDLIIHMIPIFDFIDMNITIETIQSFAIGQVIKNNHLTFFKNYYIIFIERSDKYAEILGFRLCKWTG